MRKKKLDLPSAYCEFYDCLWLNTTSKIIDRKEAGKIITHAYNIPKCLRYHIIREMELAGWIEEYQGDFIEMKHKPFNITKGTSVLSKKLGLW